MKVYNKERYRADISDNVVKAILSRLNLDGEYETVYERGVGRNIIVETDDGKRIYVIVSRSRADARNAFLAQYIPTVLDKFVGDAAARKEIYIYLADVSYHAKTPFIIDTYKSAKTLGIDILNEDALGLSEILPYLNFAEWKAAKVSRQNYNSANDASYAIDDGYRYVVYGKLYGANVKDATLTACQLSQIAKKENKRVVFILVKEHGTDSLSETDRKLLTFYGVEIADGEIVREKSETTVDAKHTCRRQDEFKYNLLEKYGEKKCYLCDCDIESMIIASHIHRIVDIDNSGLSDEEKRRQAVDGDNGFWLCANHDKMFENGIISFDTDGVLEVNDNLSESQRKYVDEITSVDRIDEDHLTEGLIKYLSVHNHRVGFDNKK